jgi:hypothetical protein
LSKKKKKKKDRNIATFIYQIRVKQLTPFPLGVLLVMPNFAFNSTNEQKKKNTGSMAGSSFSKRLAKFAH